MVAIRVLTVGAVGGEASYSLFILAGVSTSVFGVLVNDFLVVRKFSGFTLHVTVFLQSLLTTFPSCTKVRRRLDKYCIWTDTKSEVTSL